MSIVLRQMPFYYAFITFILVIGVTTQARADEEGEINTKPLTATAQFKGNSAVSGKTNKLVFQLTLDEKYKAYLDQFKLKPSEESNGLSVKSFEVSPLIKFMDTFSGREREGFKGNGELTALVDVAADLTGEQSAVFDLTYQACTEKHCLFPTVLKVPVSFKAVTHSLESNDEHADHSKKSTGLLDFESAMKRGLSFTFFVVFLAGILTSLTPCIFPMIPITLSIIGASQIKGGPGSETAINKKSRMRGFLLSCVYVLGIAITYAILGVVAAKTGALFGAALSNPYVVWAIAILFVALGLSMYGLYEIQMPAFIRDKIGTKKTDAGFVGAFVAGLIAGVVASPCVGPVLVSVLTYVAQTQNALLGFWLLFTFAIGMGLLLIAIGTFSSLASKLPRSGAWMESIKFVFGTAMVGMALFYLEPVTSASLFYLLFAAACVLISSSFGAFDTPHDGFSKIKKGVMIAIFVMGLTYMVRGLMYDVPFVLPTVGANSTTPHSAADHGDWKVYSDQAFEEAMQQGKPVIIDFYADWCAACKELEKFTFSAPEVKILFNDFILLRADLTVETQDNAHLKSKFKIMGLPTLHIFNKGKQISELTLTGFESKGDFANRLRQALR